MTPRKTRQATRNDLLDAALSHFAEFGFQETSHADIAGAAGIGRTTFYEYFSSTEDLLVQLVEARLPLLAAELVASLVEITDPRDQLGYLVARMVEFVATDHLGLILHTEVPRLGEGAQRQIAVAHQQLSEAFVDVYHRGTRSGLFRDIPGRLAARLIYEVIMATGRELMALPEPKQRVHEYADAAVTFLLGGLGRGA